jgi:hypothetical protein
MKAGTLCGHPITKGLSFVCFTELRNVYFIITWTLMHMQNLCIFSSRNHYHTRKLEEELAQTNNSRSIHDGLPIDDARVPPHPR